MIKNKIIFLQGSEEEVLSDIKKVFEDYDKDPSTCKITEDLKQFSAYWIGQIPLETILETGEVISMTEDYHANLYLPEDFDTSIFVTKKPTPPSNPYHTF